MPHIEKSALILHSAADMCALVDDIDRYPEFLPWCGGASVLRRDAATAIATILIDYRGIRQSFTTENLRVGDAWIDMRFVDGPFRKLDGRWTFQALEEAACKVSLALDYEFASAVLAKAVGPVFEFVASTMIDRFIARADQVYGGP